MTQRNHGPAIGSGIMARQQTTVHTFKYGALWFRTEKDRDHYQWTQTTRKAAKRAGWPHESIRELKEFDDYREAIRKERRLQKERAVANRAERDLIRQELGLHPSAGIQYAQTRIHADKTLRYAQTLNNQEMNNAQRLELIRQMIEDKTPIQQFMMRVSQLVGAKL